MIGRLLGLGRSQARLRAGELLETFDLCETGQKVAKTLSGGMRRRLDLAASLVGRPAFLYLDEPTTGLDPRSRLQLWDLIGDLVKGGTTVLLTTQYLEEADKLADSIVVMDSGRVIASGTAQQLKTQLGGSVIEAQPRDPADLEVTQRILSNLASGAAAARHDGQRVTVPVADADELRLGAQRLNEAGVALVHLALRQPTLDEVFFSLTGHPSEKAGSALSSVR
jgi:ABC-type multidrug transport system ATPase subunit